MAAWGALGSLGAGLGLSAWGNDWTGSRSTNNLQNLKSDYADASVDALTALSNSFNQSSQLYNPYIQSGMGAMQRLGSGDIGPLDESYFKNLELGNEKIMANQAAGGMSDSSATWKTASNYANTLLNNQVNTQYNRLYNQANTSLNATNAVNSLRNSYMGNINNIYTQYAGNVYDAYSNHGTQRGTSGNSIGDMASIIGGSAGGLF